MYIMTPINSITKGEQIHNELSDMNQKGKHIRS